MKDGRSDGMYEENERENETCLPSFSQRARKWGAETENRNMEEEEEEEEVESVTGMNPLMGTFIQIRLIVIMLNN